MGMGNLQRMAQQMQQEMMRIQGELEQNRPAVTLRYVVIERAAGRVHLFGVRQRAAPHRRLKYCWQTCC